MDKVEIRLDGVVEYLGAKWIFELKSYKRFKSKDDLFVDNQLKTYMAISKMQNMDYVGVLFCQVKKDIPEEPKILKNGKLSTAKTQKCSADRYLEVAESMYGDNIPENVYECYNELLNKKDNIEIIEVMFDDKVLESHIHQLEMVANDMDALDKYRRIKKMQEFKNRAYPNYGFACNMCNYKEKCYKEEL